ncbi:isochorismate synthase EntC [Salmonella enterica]|nr:isochorismate synthase EntC [Salmonella enterica subsp. diarizonae]EDI1748905.1 isochorismate synthase [Salmonella enterica]EJB7647974.1 isochorismate synthase EntC [Salmonella enterica]ELW8654245.1 isochorismate synthase EntC [Salmonella enterica]
MQTMDIIATNSFFFMSPFHSFTTSGCYMRFAEPALNGASPDSVFQQKLKKLFTDARSQGIENPIVVGAIPFDTCQPSSLFIPQYWQSFSRAEKQLSSRYLTRYQHLKVVERQDIPEQNIFEQMVAYISALTATSEVDKVVLSRLIDITTDADINSGMLLERLIAQNPASYNFHVPFEDGTVLLGASPELLLRKDGNQFTSLPLAGSARRQPDVELDREAGQRLLASEKDRHEHYLVTQAMKILLAGRSTELQLSASPQLIATPTLWHLGTSFEGEAKSQENSLTLACLLHPTPALSGFPHQVAKDLITKFEPFNRELFGGIVGWCDAEGNGEWVVAIRCARLHKNQVRLFAGAGIVPASSPAREWRETSVKLSTMLNAFGLK